jgi:hypothetical protein
MNTTETKQLALIEQYIKATQKFLDENITDDKAMTSLAIAMAMKDILNYIIPEEVFAAAFRLAVREGKITGIEGIKKIGYRRLNGAPKVKAPKVDHIAESFIPYIDKVQAFVDQKIQGETKMTAAVIYQKYRVTDKNCTLSENDFIQAFRQAIHDGKIKGLEGAKKAGYKRSNGQTPAVTAPTSAADRGDEVEVPWGCEIVIDDSHRIVALDDKNWGYQKRGTGAWANAAYFGNSIEMVHGIALRIVDDNLKLPDSIDISQFGKKIVEAESRIMERLRLAMVERDWGTICNKLSLPVTSKSEEVIAAIQSLIDAANTDDGDQSTTHTENQFKCTCEDLPARAPHYDGCPATRLNY